MLPHRPPLGQQRRKIMVRQTWCIVGSQAGSWGWGQRQLLGWSSHPLGVSQRGWGRGTGKGLDHGEPRAGSWWVDVLGFRWHSLRGSDPPRPEVGKAGCVQERQSLGPDSVGRGRGRGGGWRGTGRGTVCTHTCAAPGSCSGRPGAGPVGSGSSADRPAWLSWGPAVGHTAQQGPCEEGDEALVTRTASCPPPTSLGWELLPAASPLSGRTSETLQADTPSPLSDR